MWSETTVKFLKCVSEVIFRSPGTVFVWTKYKTVKLKMVIWSTGFLAVNIMKTYFWLWHWFLFQNINCDIYISLQKYHMIINHMIINWFQIFAIEMHKNICVERSAYKNNEHTFFKISTCFTINIKLFNISQTLWFGKLIFK